MSIITGLAEYSGDAATEVSTDPSAFGRWAIRPGPASIRMWNTCLVGPDRRRPANLSMYSSEVMMYLVRFGGRDEGDP